jgi:hypothetical protein
VGALFDALAREVITVEGVETFALGDARAAHELLESRRSRGPLILTP